MNLLSKKLSFALLSAVVVLTGCTKKPKRPSPGDTLGQGIGVPLDGSATDNLGAQGIVDPSASGLQAKQDGVFEDENMIKGLFKPVLFDFDSSGIKASERPKLQEAQKYIAEHPQYRLLLEGHCDWRGTAEYNLGLGDRRASSARQYVQSLGLAASKLEILSKGDLDAVENASEDQMAKDRRVEIIILKK
ncbi:MAG: OmpA family protein [Opitutaceae bacterium]|nr:OmpA family protein [Opitutaceae bacterium]